MYVLLFALQPDPGVPLQFSSANEDYKRSGWSRGHMTPAGDCKHCQGAMDDTFYLTNIVPQDFDNNSGYVGVLHIHTIHVEALSSGRNVHILLCN